MYVMIFIFVHEIKINTQNYVGLAVVRPDVILFISMYSSYFEYLRQRMYF
jgi:hypothetical protein